MSLDTFSSFFWPLLTQCVNYLLNFNFYGISLGYIMISSFVIGVIIDAIILKP